MRAMFTHRAASREVDMKRRYLKLSRVAGELLQQSSAAVVALLIAAVRGLRLLPDDLPGHILGTIDALEWALACLGLVFVFSDTLHRLTEKDHD